MLKTLQKTNKTFLYSTLLASIFLFANSVYTPFVTPYLISQGYADSQISFIFALAPLSLIIFPPILGNLADLIGRKRILNYTSILYALSLILFLYTQDHLFILITAIIISNVCFEGFLSTALEKAEDNIGEGRGLLTGVFESLKSIGGLAGSLLGTLIVGFLPISSLFKVSAAVALFIFLINNLKRSTNHNKVGFKDVKIFSSIKKFWQTEELRGMAVLGMTMNASNPAKAIFVPLLLTQVLGAGIQYVGYFATALLFSHLFQALFGYICDIKGSQVTIIRSVSIFAVLISLLFFANNPITIILLGFFLGLSTSSWNTSAWCYMSEVGEKYQEEGFVVGTYMSFVACGMFIGFFLSGLITKFIGIRYVFLLYGVLVLIGILWSRKYLTKNIKQISLI